MREQASRQGKNKKYFRLTFIFFAFVPFAFIMEHSFLHQYNPNDGEYYFYLDDAYVWHQDANFLSGTRVAAGGEVGLGVEQMKDVHISNLLYIKNNAGVFSYQDLNGYVDYQQDAPYSNTDGGPNDFFDHGP